ncbi:hypothetical protein T440DRAFT_552296 [Plenodomus tracheiphilus IPT5]|uniref:KANL3/Tex30 alpha/beta hydrolase-like domain-containing protein n=1 Tax=Plenodomus tracheiphilus IPT5 TaxID=1408161 RepID=A0A6A7BG08_9PLEO|nr:hypothetical protein T440DRAFT_552296 [Plenodomus tracheiphilus IPT5]
MSGVGCTSNGATNSGGTGSQVKPTIQGLVHFDKPIDKSTIQSYEDVIERLREPLLKGLLKGRVQFRPMAIRLVVLGTDEASARPCIVVFCPESATKKVKQYFWTGNAQRLCRPDCVGMINFDVIIDSHPLNLKANPRPMDVTLSQLSDLDNRPWNAQIKIGGIGTTSYAVMGGIVVVVDNNGASSIYGLTAGHTLVQAAVDKDYESHGADEDSASEVMAVAECPNQQSGEQQLDTMQDDASSSITASHVPVDTIASVTVREGRARIAHASFSQKARNRDWALIEGIEDFYPVGSASEPVNTHFEDDTRHGLVHAQESVEIVYQPRCIGTLSGVPAYIVLPLGDGFVRAHTVSPRDGQVIPAGTSGSWVVVDWTNKYKALHDDADHVGTNHVRVYGHVVADDALGDVYMIPLVDTLKDIAQEIGNAREARLPESASEIETVLGKLRIKMPDDPPDATGPYIPRPTSSLAQSAFIRRQSDPHESQEERSQANDNPDIAGTGPRDTTRTSFKGTFKRTNDEASGATASESSRPEATDEQMSSESTTTLTSSNRKPRGGYEMTHKRRRAFDPEPAPEPKRRVTRSSTRAQGTTSPPPTKEPMKNPSTTTKAAAKRKPKNGTTKNASPISKSHKPRTTHKTPSSISPAKAATPPLPDYTTLTITSDLIKDPIQCHEYNPKPTTTTPTLIFTHGAGGTLSAPAVQNFCTGYSLTHPILAFKGSMNLASRVKGFHACIAHLASSKQDRTDKNESTGKKTILLLSGRSMGSRAAVIAATETLSTSKNITTTTSPPTINLILSSYPLLSPSSKPPLRDKILIDLPSTVNVLFIVGEKDAMCPFDLLNETRGKMVAKSQVVVVRGADHGMCVRGVGGGKMREREIGEETGRVAGRWVDGGLEGDGDVLYIGDKDVGGD